jgi:hypothetical protein
MAQDFSSAGQLSFGGFDFPGIKRNAHTKFRACDIAIQVDGRSRTSTFQAIRIAVAVAAFLECLTAAK